MSTPELQRQPAQDIEPVGVAVDYSDPATQEIAQAMEEAGSSIPYSTFMELSLYGTAGFYAAGKAQINTSGLAVAFAGGPAFATMASSYEFNESLARQGAMVDEALGGPDPMTILEVGAGHGSTASDVIGWTRRSRPELYGRLGYRIIEPGDLIHKQGHTLSGYAAGTPSDNPIEKGWADGESDYNKVSWIRNAVMDAEVEPFDGFIFSNEVPDASPIDIIRNTAGQLQQLYITTQEGIWAKKWAAPSDTALAYLKQHAITVQPGKYETVNPGAALYQQKLSSMLKRGAITTLDYGQFGQEHAEKLPLRFFAAGPIKRIGTEEGLTREQLTFRFPGKVDITANVNFEPMQRAAEEAGLTIAFAGLQSAFLLANGFRTKDELEAAKKLPQQLWPPGSDPQFRPGDKVHNERLGYAAGILSKTTFQALVVTRGIDLPYPPAASIA